MAGYGFNINSTGKNSFLGDDDSFMGAFISGGIRKNSLSPVSMLAAGATAFFGYKLITRNKRKNERGSGRNGRK